MKKIFVLILFAFSFFVSFGQGIVPRSGSSVTVADARLQATLNLLAPRYADTTAANTSIGIDSCGALIFTYDVNWYWVRQCNPKRWSMLPTISGSLNTTINIIDSNHISICTINGCDTITITGIVGPITNVTIINNNELRVCGSDILGNELITNGGFVGSATGWTLGTLWAYGSNNITHSFGSTATSFQGGGLVEGGSYYVGATISGGAAGSVALALDAGTSNTYNFNSGPITFTGTWNAGINSKINFAPTNDFDGNITDVSVKQLLPNCDTLQIVPGQNFLDSVIIYAKTPLYALNDSTFAIRQSSLNDSGYLSKGGYDSFYRKVDSLTHFAQNNIDFLQFVKNGVTTNWDTVHVNCYGLDEPGQVLWSGFGLDYIVNSAFYHINCKPYISPSTVLTLGPADATLPRIDLVYVDSSGNAGVLTGTPAVNPVKPQIDPFWQLELTTITVPATATIVPVDTLIIFNENIAAPTEWTPVTNVGTTTDPDNTLFVYRGVKSINVTNINVGDSIIFTSSTPVDLSAYQSVVFFIKLKEVIPASAQLRVQWQNGGSFVGGIVNVPIDKNNTTTYQAISMPLTIFNFSSTTVTRFVFGYSNSSATVNRGFFLDFIYLQNGLAPVVPTDQTIIVGYNGLTHFKVNGIDSIRLGGTLNQATTITGTTFPLVSTSTITGSGVTFSAINTSSGNGILGQAVSGSGVTGLSTSGPALTGTSTSGLGASISSVSSFGAIISINPSSTNTTPVNVQLQRSSSGTAANGIGQALDFAHETVNGTVFSANQVVSSWSTAATATRTSQFLFTGTNSAVTTSLLTLAGTGAARLNQYGINTFAGVPTFAIGVDGSGNLVEFSASGSTSISALTAATATNNINNANFNQIWNWTTLSAGGLQLNASSSAASGNAQKLLNVTLSGANSNSGEQTYAITGSNTHTGTGSLNVGVYGIAEGGASNFAVWGQSLSASTNNTAGYFVAQNGTVNYALIVPTASGNVGFGTNAPSSAALLELASTTQALLIMRMTATQASAVSAADGMILYVTNTNGTFTSAGFWGREAGAWVKL